MYAHKAKQIDDGGDGGGEGDGGGGDSGGDSGGEIQIPQSVQSVPKTQRET